MKFLKTLAAVAGIGLMATSASAATLSFDVTGPVNQVALSSINNYNPQGDSTFLESVVGNISIFSSALPGPGLLIDENSKMTVTYLGKEAGNTNTAFSVGTAVLSTATSAIGASYVTTVAAGVLDFTFESFANGSLFASASNDGSISTNAAIAFSEIFSDEYGDFVYAFFDDSGAGVDGDFDDMVVKIQLSAVPLPAGMVLLLSAFAGFGALKRRKTV